MPDSSDPFLTLAEVGIGLAGFAGIVVALTKRVAPLTSGEAVLVRELILNSLAVVLLALLPVGLVLLGSQGAGVWRGLSAFHAALIVLVAWPSLALQVRRVPSHQRDPTTYLVIVAVGALAVALQFLNASTLLFSPSAGVYFFGVCVGPLAIGTIHFARVLFARLF
jgi:hypothetical protein